MKTIEEKAKAYDEAVKKVKDYYEGKTKMYSDVNKTLNLLFPELAESEDERIRKTIIRFFKDNYPNEIEMYDGTVTVGKAIAWLEKQSNTIPDECVFRPVAGCDIESAAKQAIKQQGVLAKEIVLAFNGAYIPVGGKAADIIVNEYNSWLEKQGEQKVTTVDFNAKDWYVSKVDGKIHNIYHSVDKAEGNDVVKCLINGMKFYYEDNEEATWGTEKFSMKVKDILSWLEKQSGIDTCPLECSTNTVMTDSKKNQVEPKFKVGDIIKFKTKDGYSEPWQIIQVDMLDKKYRLKDGYVLHFSEEDAYELVEQKAADKVEPKFKVGDWVVFNNRHDSIYQVEKIESYSYILRHISGDSLSFSFSLEDMIREWTIQDAKDGDVLVYRNSATEIIMLFKSWLLDKEVAYTHFHIFDNEYRVNGSCDCGNGAHPATKEQRDLLFQKMKEEGYEWNAEKKGFLAWGNKNPACDEENPAWNEKDDNIVKQINEYLKDLFDDYRLGVQELNDYETWLKSLKQRIGGKK